MQALTARLAQLHQEPEGRVVVALRRVMDGLVVIRICATLEQQSGQLRLMGNAGRRGYSWMARRKTRLAATMSSMALPIAL